MGAAGVGVGVEGNGGGGWGGGGREARRTQNFITHGLRKTNPEVYWRQTDRLRMLLPTD